MTAADGLVPTIPVRRRPPGPRVISPIRPLLAAACGAGYLLAGQWLIRRLFAIYGPVVAIPLPGIPVVLIKDPELVKQVFTEKPDVLLGGRGVRPSAIIYGTGSMFVQDEPEHLRRRKLLTPPLHGKALENCKPIIEDSVRRAIATWPSDRPFKMLPRGPSTSPSTSFFASCSASRTAASVARLGRPFETLLDLGVSEELTLRVALHSLGGLKHWRQAGSRKPGNRRAGDADDRCPAPGRRSARAHRHHVVTAHSSRRGWRFPDGQGDSRRPGHHGAGRTRNNRHHLGLDDRLVTASPRRAGESASGSRSGANRPRYTEAVITETLRVRPPSPFTGRYTTGHYRTRCVHGAGRDPDRAAHRRSQSQRGNL